MGLDVGHKRIGIALSDLLGLGAHPYEVWHRVGTRDDVQHIKGVCEANEVCEVVVGKPLRTDGTEGPEVRFVNEFVTALRRALPGIEIHLWDERFSTREAERALITQGVRRAKRREVVDMEAAALILQTFMERRR